MTDNQQEPLRIREERAAFMGVSHESLFMTLETMEEELDARAGDGDDAEALLRIFSRMVRHALTGSYDSPEVELHSETDLPRPTDESRTG